MTYTRKLIVEITTTLAHFFKEDQFLGFSGSRSSGWSHHTVRSAAAPPDVETLVPGCTDACSAMTGGAERQDWMANKVGLDARHAIFRCRKGVAICADTYGRTGGNVSPDV